MTKPAILLAFANDQAKPNHFPKHLRHEQQRILDLLRPLQQQGRIELLQLPDISGEMLQQHLSHYKDSLVIFHLSGEADSHYLHDTLAKEIAAIPSAKLVFLSGCASHEQLQALLNAGARAVIASLRHHDNPQTAAFACDFYQELVHGHSIEKAFEKAAAHQRGSQQIEKYTHLPAAPLPWGLYLGHKHQSVLGWQLPPVTDPNIPQVLNSPRNPHHFIGREQEMLDIEDALLKNRVVLLLNGIGGIGKSTLAQRYFHQALSEKGYDHYRWFNYSDSLKTTLISSLQPFYNIPGDKADDIFDMILNKENNLPGKKLLIIDNFDKEDNQDELRKFQGWDILVTTRLNLPNFRHILVERLPEAQAMELFYTYCPRLRARRAETEAQVKQLLDIVDRHTLLIEMVAKNVQRADGFSLEQVCRLLKKKQLKEFPENVNIPNKGHRQLIAHLEVLYTLEKLDEEAILVLKQFAVLPSQPLSFDLLCDLLQIQQDEEQQIAWAFVLTALDEKGWLRFAADENSYFCHALIKEYMYQFARPGVEDCPALVYSINEKINVDQAKDNPVEKFKWIEFGSSLLETILETRKEVAYTHDRLAGLYGDFDDYPSAEKHFKKAIAIAQELCLDSNSFQNNLGDMYRKWGKYDLAKDLLETSLNDYILKFGEKAPGISHRQSNLANVYFHLCEYNKAIKLYQKSLQNDISEFGSTHSDVAKRQVNLANVYIDLEKYEEAKDLFEKALANEINIYGENHPTVAITQANLANAYIKLGLYLKASSLLNKSRINTLNNFGENHSNMAFIQASKATIDIHLNLDKQAVHSLNQAIQIAINSFGENNPKVTEYRALLAVAYQKLGRYDDAEKLLEITLQDNLNRFGENHSSIVVGYNNLAYVYLYQNKKNLAKKYFQKAYQIALKCFGKNHHYSKSIKKTLDNVK